MGSADRPRCAEMRGLRAPNAVAGGGLHGRMERLPSKRVAGALRKAESGIRSVWPWSRAARRPFCASRTPIYANFLTVSFSEPSRPHSLPERSYARAVIDALPGPRKPEAFLSAPCGETRTGELRRLLAVCADAGLGRQCLNDLGHTAASQAVMAGENLPLAGKILGHRWPRTTAGYAHLADAHLVEAAERVGSIIAAALESAPPANQPRGCLIDRETPKSPLRQPAETRCRVTC